MSISQKHADFVRDKKIGNKPVEAVAGIGDKPKVFFAEINVFYAYQLLGIFLQYGRDQDAFYCWLKYHAPSMNSKHLADCIACINDWCEKHL